MTTDSAAEVEVARSITVPLGQAKAFDLFTTRMTEFWLPEHSIGASPFEAVVLEPRVGGRWFERSADGNECDWGRVQRYGEHAEQMRAIFDSPNGWTDTLNRCARLAESECIGIHHGDGARRTRGVRFVP